MADLERAMTELARLRSDNEPIVSVYLDVRWSDEQQRDRVRLFVQEAIRRALAHYPGGTPGREGLGRSFGRIHRWVSDLRAHGEETEPRGVAAFACESLRLWRTLAFERTVGNDLATDAVPHLSQLARLARDAAPVIVAAPGREGAELFAVRLGAIEAAWSLRQPVPRSDQDEFEPGATRLVGNEGPTSRYERSDKGARHDENVARRIRKVAAAELGALFDRYPEPVVVLLGPPRALSAFERDLPERVAARVAARLPRPRAWQSGDGVRRDAVLAAAVEGARAAVGRAGHRPEALVGEALRGGVAVLGPEDVVLALNEGRVHTLVVEEDFRRAGWRCDNCDALGANVESGATCPYCGGDARAVLDLGETLVARTLAVGGRVEVVPHEKRLHGYKGVGAFLRQMAPTGLRGANPTWRAAPGASQS